MDPVVNSLDRDDPNNYVSFDDFAGSFNLATGVFTRSGIAVNQLGIYGVDSIIMATVRGAPGVINATYP